MKKFLYNQKFRIRPKVKGRPRMTRSGRAYTPKDTLEYEAKIAEAYKGPLFKNSLLSMTLVFSRDGTEMTIKVIEREPTSPYSSLTGDVDNYAKAILDALNGVAYTDDKQIIRLYVEKT